MAALLTAATGAYIYNKTQNIDQEDNYIYPAKSPEQEKEERERNERIWIEQAREQKDREENLRESRLAREKAERRKQVIQAYLAKKTKRKLYSNPSFWKHPIAYTNKYILHKNEHELGLDTCDGVDQQYYKTLEEIAEESGATNSWQFQEDFKALDTLHADHDRIQLPQESLLKQCRERRRQAFTEFKNQPLEVHTQRYDLSKEAITLIESYGVDIEDYLICVGNQIQQYIHGELTQLLEVAAQHAGEEVDVIVDMVTDTVQAGVHYCKNLCVVPAITMSDVGYAILDFSKGVLVGIAIEGAIAGTVCLVSVTCPVLAPAVHMGLRALYYYHVANATIYVAKEAFDCIEIARTSQTNEEFNARMAKKGEEFKEAIKEVCSPYNIGMAVGGAYGAQKVNNWFANRQCKIEYFNI